MWRWIIWFLTWLSADPADIGRESARAAASIAAERATMVASPDVPPDPAPPDGTCCIDCGGTGVIVHGDGHKTPCPCPASCACKRPRAPMPAASPTPGKPATP